jgi:hypothetical protein
MNPIVKYLQTIISIMNHAYFSVKVIHGMANSALDLLTYVDFYCIFFTGPEMLLRQSSDLRNQERVNTNFGGDTGDAFEAHEWRYVRTFNGIFNSLYTIPVGS